MRVRVRERRELTVAVQVRERKVGRGPLDRFGVDVRAEQLASVCESLQPEQDATAATPKVEDAIE
jgi:hypothetical protein